jgi:histidine ammonia-lyase
MSKMETFLITGREISPEELYDAVINGRKIAFSPEAVAKMEKSRETIHKLVTEGKVIYGVTTGFGSLCNSLISREETETLQKNIVISHACGVGKPLPSDVVKMIMIITAARFARGHSGVEVATAQTLLDMSNRGVIPIVPEKGSIGASGDLVPLAHIALVCAGMGEAEYSGERLAGSEALMRVGIKPVTLSHKEGLALLNGTQVMSSQGIFALVQAQRLYKTANMAAALTIEALKANTAPFDRRVHAIRPHPGQVLTAQALLSYLDGSKNTDKTKTVQDAYSLRCVPQVHGASWDAINYVKAVLTTELNSVTDNPLIFPDEGDVISAGNFHGQPLALALDFLAIAVSELANISERRIERLVNPALSGLEPFLVKGSGLNSGYMIPQYTAAGLVSENKILASPASVDSIPTSAGQEDHVSMGSIAARKVGVILENTKNVLAVELMCAAQAIDLGGSAEGLAPATKKAYGAIRKAVPFLERDRILYTDMAKIAELITEEALFMED